MDSMAPHSGRWRLALRSARGRLRALLGDALVSAACTAYHGPMSEALRKETLQDWLDR